MRRRADRLMRRRARPAPAKRLAPCGPVAPIPALPAAAPSNPFSCLWSLGHACVRRQPVVGQAHCSTHCSTFHRSPPHAAPFVGLRCTGRFADEQQGGCSRARTGKRSAGQRVRAGGQVGMLNTLHICGMNAYYDSLMRSLNCEWAMPTATPHAGAPSTNDGAKDRVSFIEQLLNAQAQARRSVACSRARCVAPDLASPGPRHGNAHPARGAPVLPPRYAARNGPQRRR